MVLQTCNDKLYTIYRINIDILKLKNMLIEFFNFMQFLCLFVKLIVHFFYLFLFYFYQMLIHINYLLSTSLMKLIHFQNIFVYL